MSKHSKSENHIPYTEQLRDLIDRAQKSDETALPELRKLLDDTPELWQQIGDLAQHVEAAWVKLLAPTDLFTQDCLRREAERRRIELLGDEPSPIQRHLVERVVACWLQVQYAEIVLAKSQDVSDSRLGLLHKRLGSAQKQHLAAVRELLKVQTECKATKPTSGKVSGKGQESGAPSKQTKHHVAA